MKTILHPMFEEVSGAMGRMVYRQAYGKTVISRKPVVNEEDLTVAQQENQARFTKAAAYGKKAMADEDARPLYDAAAKERKMPVFAVAMADFFNAPTIHTVNVFGYSGNVGDTITILAGDDFGVAKVHVMISNPDGDPIENGEAVESGAGSGEWIYTATVQGQPIVKVQAVAQDRPGGTTTMNINKTF
jgi:hypothetical protein